MCLEEGMIFHSWYKLIEKLPLFVAKPLGLCIYCFSTWVAIAFYLYHIHQNMGIVLDFIELLQVIGFNYVFVELIQKIQPSEKITS